MILTDEIKERLKKDKPYYIVSRRFIDKEQSVLNTEDEKLAVFRADFEAKNKVDNYEIYLTVVKKQEHCISFEERFINEKTLTRTIRSKRFKKL